MRKPPKRGSATDSLFPVHCLSTSLQYSIVAPHAPVHFRDRDVCSLAISMPKPGLSSLLEWQGWKSPGIKATERLGSAKRRVRIEHQITGGWSKPPAGAQE